MAENQLKMKPRYFASVGWSWATMGLLGVVMGAVGLLAIPGILAAKKMLLNAEGGVSPEMVASIMPLINLWIPSSIIKLITSSLLTYVSFMFLKGKRWAYITLEWINYFIIVAVTAGYFISMKTVGGMIQKIQTTGAFEGTGIDLSLPDMFHPLMLFLLVLFLVPFLIIAWYFRWKPVKEYFAETSSLN
jgi:hypothetical protein